MTDIRFAQPDIHQHAINLVVGTLLTGGGTMFGKPVALSWPEGMPPGVTEGFLRNLGEQMIRDSAGPSKWIEKT
jgi:hypothetical protein